MLLREGHIGIFLWEERGKPRPPNRPCSSLEMKLKPELWGTGFCKLKMGAGSTTASCHALQRPNRCCSSLEGEKGLAYHAAPHRTLSLRRKAEGRPQSPRDEGTWWGIFLGAAFVPPPCQEMPAREPPGRTASSPGHVRPLESHLRRASCPGRLLCPACLASSWQRQVGACRCARGLQRQVETGPSLPGQAHPRDALSAEPHSSHPHTVIESRRLSRPTNHICEVMGRRPGHARPGGL